MKRIKINIASAALLLTAMAALVMTGCSTTSKLEDGEILYNGMKLDLHPVAGEKLPGEMVSDMKKAVNVKPNNPLPFISPYMRSPFPVGLWVYNHMNDSAGGLKGWIYRKLVEQPVLVTDARPDTRVKMLESILDDNGYFGSKASFSTQSGKNPKKGKIVYDIDVPRPYLIDSIEYINDGTKLGHLIDTISKRSRYLRKGERFCVDSLISVRTKIANTLRNIGYYYFRPEYIEYLADTLITRHAVALRVTLAENIPDIARLQYRVGNVVTYVTRRSTRNPGTPDTIFSSPDRGDVIVYRPAKLRKNLIPSCVTFRKGRIFSVWNMDRTQERLSRLGIFSNIQMQAVPADTSASNPTLDLFINCQFDRPMEATLEANLAYKSNSYLGPGLIFGVTNNNTFGGAEKLSLTFNANYEWQTGRNRGSVFNSYEFGVTGSLAFPRLLAPKFLKRTENELNWTTVSLGVDLMNRPHYFKMADFHVGLSYEWHPTRHVLNQLTLFKLTYNKLMHTTPEFDAVMEANPAVALSFQSQYIPQLSYTYTLDKFLERDKINGINFTATLTEAGNVFDGIYSLCGVKGEKRLFGTPFSQFVKRGSCP